MNPASCIMDPVTCSMFLFCLPGNREVSLIFDDQQSYVGNKIEDQKDNFEEPEK